MSASCKLSDGYYVIQCYQPDHTHTIVSGVLLDADNADQVAQDSARRKPGRPYSYRVAYLTAAGGEPVPTPPLPRDAGGRAVTTGQDHDWPPLPAIPGRENRGNGA